MLTFRPLEDIVLNDAI